MTCKFFWRLVVCILLMTLSAGCAPAAAPVPPTYTAAPRKILPLPTFTETVEPAATFTLAPTPTPLPLAETPTEPGQVFPTLPVPLAPQEADFAGWKEGSDTNAGLVFRYPADWKVEFQPAQHGEQEVGAMIILHPADTADSIFVRLAYRKTGEQVFLWPMGVGCGEFIPWVRVPFLGAEVDSIALVCNGLISQIHYRPADTLFTMRGGFEFAILVGLSGPSCEEGVGITAGQEQIAEWIIASFAWAE